MGGGWGMGGPYLLGRPRSRSSPIRHVLSKDRPQPFDLLIKVRHTFPVGDSHSNVKSGKAVPCSVECLQGQRLDSMKPSTLPGTHRHALKALARHGSLRLSSRPAILRLCLNDAQSSVDHTERFFSHPTNWKRYNCT